MNVPTRKGFEAWLKKHRRETVGECGNPRRCALATYVMDLNPEAEGVLVSTRYLVDRDGNRDRKHMQKWALEFTREFDELGDYGSKRTGAEALKALEGVK